MNHLLKLNNYRLVGPSQWSVHAENAPQRSVNTISAITITTLHTVWLAVKAECGLSK